MVQYGYVRTSVASSDPESQALQLRKAGVDSAHTFRDLAVSGRKGATSREGWSALSARLVEGDTVVVGSIDRLGRRWLDVVTTALDLRRRGVRIRSLSEQESTWACYLDLSPDDPQAFVGVVLLSFSAWVANEEANSISRRTKAGLTRAKAEGKRLGRPPALSEEQVSAAAYLRATGHSDRAISRTLGVAASTVAAYLADD